MGQKVTQSKHNIGLDMMITFTHNIGLDMMTTCTPTVHILQRPKKKDKYLMAVLCMWIA